MGAVLTVARPVRAMGGRADPRVVALEAQKGVVLGSAFRVEGSGMNLGMRELALVKALAKLDCTIG
jgi:hypothetical protein